MIGMGCRIRNVQAGCVCGMCRQHCDVSDVGGGGGLVFFWKGARMSGNEARWEGGGG